MGNAFANTLWFFVTGVIFSVTPIVAQLFGAKKYKEIGKKLREILWIAALLGFLLTFIIYNFDLLLNFFPIKDSITNITDGLLEQYK